MHAPVSLDVACVTGDGWHERPAAAARIPRSCLHEVFAAVEEHERRSGRRALGLHVGEQSFAAPAQAIDALGAAARNGRCVYTPAEGMLELRETLVSKLERVNCHRTRPDLVFATPG